MRTKLSAMTYFHGLNRLGRPLAPMTRLHKILRAYARMDGGAVHTMRLSREFLVAALNRRRGLGKLLDLCLASC